MLTKNVLWLGVASALAAICLFTAIARYETTSTVDVRDLGRAIRDITRNAAERVHEQDEAAQDFADALAEDLERVNRRINRYCDRVHDNFPGEPSPSK